MRISDNRYNRDRLRFDLAIRMMHHRARSATIRAWTGLSEDRIRKLHKSYLLQRSSRPQVRRRGKSPRQAVYFLQTAALCFEATTLASLLHAGGLVGGPDYKRGHQRDQPRAGDGAVAMTLQRAQTFCQTYEAFLQLCPSTRLTFEHAWFLLACLLRRDRIELAHCKSCGRLYLTETGRLAAPSCGCGQRRQGWPRRGRLPGSLIQAYDGWTMALMDDQQHTRAALQSG